MKTRGRPYDVSLNKKDKTGMSCVLYRIYKNRRFKIYLQSIQYIYYPRLIFSKPYKA